MRRAAASAAARAALTARARAPRARLRRNTREFDADGRVLRLKRFISAVAGSAVLDAVLDALAVNTRVEVLYIQNFEKGFTDAQLLRLTQARRRHAGCASTLPLPPSPARGSASRCACAPTR